MNARQYAERIGVPLLAAFPGDKPDELRLHARFARHSIGAEWFEWCPEIEDFLFSLRGAA